MADLFRLGLRMPSRSALRGGARSCRAPGALVLDAFDLEERLVAWRNRHPIGALRFAPCALRRLIFNVIGQQPSASACALLLSALDGRTWQRQPRLGEALQHLPVGRAAQAAAQLDRRHRPSRIGGERLPLVHNKLPSKGRAALVGVPNRPSQAPRRPPLFARGTELCLTMPDVCYIWAMDRNAAIARLKVHEGELRRLGVRHLYLFGSTARGEARDDSDIDLFFDYERGRLGLYELMDVMDTATTILGRKADVVTRDSLHPTLRGKIEADALQVF